MQFNVLNTAIKILYLKANFTEQLAIPFMLCMERQIWKYMYVSFYLSKTNNTKHFQRPMLL